MDILSMVTRVPILVFGVERNDDDFADRINYKYTVAVLVIFAIIVTNRQFGTKQIHCWIPAYFTRNYEEYINDICWVSNTYYISLDQRLPEAEDTRKSFELKYYQWVPFILLSQAFFFYIPHIAWRALSRRSGLDVRDIVEAASNYKSVDKYEHRQKYMSYMLTAVDQYVGDPRRGKESRHSIILKRILSSVCCMSGKFLGNYLMVLYLFIKLAFIANCISQLFVLNLLLGHEFHKFGFELIDKIINGKGWDTGSRIFPKISMCDFRIREVGNPKVSHRYTVQCVLPINLFNQQIFTFIWFWYGIVLFVNIYSLCVWTYRFLPSKRLRYVARRIEIMRQASFASHKKNQLNFDQPVTVKIADFEKEIIIKFVNDYLESDGLFILRVLASNTSDFVCTELIQELWKYYKLHGKYDKINQIVDHDDDLTNSDFDFDEESQQKIAGGRTFNQRGPPKLGTNVKRMISYVNTNNANASNRTKIENSPLNKTGNQSNDENETDNNENYNEDDDENYEDYEEEELPEGDEASKASKSSQLPSVGYSRVQSEPGPPPGQSGRRMSAIEAERIRLSMQKKNRVVPRAMQPNKQLRNKPPSDNSSNKQLTQQQQLYSRNQERNRPSSSSLDGNKLPSGYGTTPLSPVGELVGDASNGEASYDLTRSNDKYLSSENENNETSSSSGTSPQPPSLSAQQPRQQFQQLAEDEEDVDENTRLRSDEHSPDESTNRTLSRFGTHVSRNPEESSPTSEDPQSKAKAKFYETQT